MKRYSPYQVFRLRSHSRPLNQDAHEMFRKLESPFMVLGFLAVLCVSAHASPKCAKGQKPFALSGDTISWTMTIAPGSECIQGLRWSYMQIYSVLLSKAPKN